jgi:mono/diheme cytochrome c family protein
MQNMRLKVMRTSIMRTGTRTGMGNKLGKLARVTSAALLVAALAGGFARTARAQDAPPGDAVEGKRLFLAVGCFLCHGRAGQGGAMNGPAPVLAKTAMPFEGFMGQLRRPINDMPAYSEKVMTDKQVADIYAFVQSLPGPRLTKDMKIFDN